MNETPQITITLKKGREKPVKKKHPWIFSGAIEKRDGDPEQGELVRIVDAQQNYLATAYYNRISQIRCRILTWDMDEVIDEAFWNGRIQTAIQHRQQLNLPPHTNAFRLINGESDFLPGLIVDKYGDYLVMQCLTAGIDARKERIAQILATLCQPKGIVERSDAYARKREGLPKTTGMLYGEAPPNALTIQENGVLFNVDLLNGQKTGFYLDQRENRTAVTQPTFVQDKTVLNVFAYTGGFGLFAIQNGAKTVINIDSSIEALEQAEKNVALNSWERPDDEYLAGDAFEILRYYRNQNAQFDMIILDPPKFAKSQKDIDGACRGYKDLNWLAFRLLKPGGLLATFSCSGLVSRDLFQKVLFGAAVDAQRDVQIIQQFNHAPDHPTAITVPESAYLKGFLLRAL
ncbi:MAG: class I SAM-dependent rRNA methyltransferase [Chloroflexota bacterium]